MVKMNSSVFWFIKRRKVLAEMLGWMKCVAIRQCAKFARIVAG